MDDNFYQHHSETFATFASNSVGKILQIFMQQKCALSSRPPGNRRWLHASWKIGEILSANHRPTKDHRKCFLSKTVSVRIPAKCRRQLLQTSVEKVPQSSSLLRKKFLKNRNTKIGFGAEKFLTRRLLRTVLRKLSEFLCNTNIWPAFFPMATGASSMYRRHLGKSVKFEAQTIGRRKSP